jgi:hypothetical protein
MLGGGAQAAEGGTVLGAAITFIGSEAVAWIAGV